MADKTHISWTNATWNIITGCSVVTPGCTNCYAMRLAGTRLKNHPSREGLTDMTKTGPVWNGQVRFNEKWLDQPLRWRKPRMIFVCAHGDLFHESVPDEWITRVWDVMRRCPQHIFQVLTKRSERMRDFVSRCANWEGWITHNGAPPKGYGGDGIIVGRDDRWPLPNVWLGVSVEDQERADERREALAQLACDDWLTWVSYEPALGPVDWSTWWFPRWMVAGGESAQNKPGRPAHPDWFRDTRDWCQAAGVAFHFKQWGDWAPEALAMKGCWPDSQKHEFDDCLMIRVGAKKAGRLLDGREWNETPVTDQ